MSRSQKEVLVVLPRRLKPNEMKNDHLDSLLVEERKKKELLRCAVNTAPKNDPAVSFWWPHALPWHYNVMPSRRIANGFRLGLQMAIALCRPSCLQNHFSLGRGLLLLA